MSIKEASPNAGSPRASPQQTAGRKTGSSRTAALKTVGVLTFFGMTVAIVASVRNIPNVAATGWTMFFYMLVATLLFALPITLMSGEYAAKFPRAGGPELWVTKGLSPRWGFTTSWLLWVQMFPGMVMVASVVAPLVAVTIGDTQLGSNSIFTLICIVVTYWTITILNLFFDMARIGGRIGVILGLYLPVAFMMVLGVIALFKVGIQKDSYLGGAATGRVLLPFSSQSVSTLAFFASIVFIYSGIEMSSVYIPRLKTPVKTYLRGIFMALIFMFAFNTLLAFVTANVIPKGTIDLNNIAQAPVIILGILGLPSWLGNVFAASVLVGVVVQLSAWASGPSKTITSSARRGLYPPKLRFWKTNQFDVAPTVLITQATVISFFALIFILIPGVNNAFLLLVTATAIIYIVVYVLMAIGILRLRSTQSSTERAFHMGNKRVAWTVMVVFLITVFASSVATLWYQGWTNAFIIVAITAVLTAAPLIIYRRHKPSWASDVAVALHAEGVDVTS
ncbi:amino acid permease [Nakamurella antarctica]|uniref:Amino acid permease n=1 Tax=Nakamurella antarctica TaxID=1902245 RepID=A0A3G8ZTS8_9ACTN|nr:amino acid permease [Nakamurella antarctica]AZI57201.1 amino acid permease [Nakamurella antarctica]